MDGTTSSKGRKIMHGVDPLDMINLFEKNDSFVVLIVNKDDETRALFLVLRYDYKFTANLKKTIQEVFIPFDGEKIILISGLMHNAKEPWEVPEVACLFFQIAASFPQLICDKNLHQSTRQSMVFCECVWGGMTILPALNYVPSEIGEQTTRLTTYHLSATDDQEKLLRPELKHVLADMCILFETLPQNEG